MGARAERRFEQEQTYREAFIRAGLACEIERLEFEVSFAGIIEWFRIRWLPVISPDRAEPASQMLYHLARQLSDRRFILEEKLLIGHRSKAV